MNITWKVTISYFFSSSSQTALLHINFFLTNGAAMLFPNSYATTGNRTHVSSVASLLRDALPTKLSQLQQVVGNPNK